MASFDSTGTPTPKKTATKKTATKKTKAHGLPTSGARLAQYLANPGLRSKLPDSSLTPDLLQARQTNAFNAQPAAPGSSYTNGTLNQLLAALTSTKFGPQQAALGQAQTALDTRGNAQIPAWFQGYRDTLAGLQGAQSAAQTAQVQSLNDMAKAASGDLGLPPGADPAAVARAQAAAQMRSAGIGNQAALAQNLGTVQGNYLGNLGALSYGQQAGAVQDLFGRQSQLNDQKTQLQSDIGSFKTTQRGQVLSDEASNALKASLTNSQVNQNTANTAATKASTKKTKADTTKTQKDQAFFDAHGYYPQTGPTKPKSPDVITSGPFAGYTKTQVAGMTPAEKTKLTAKAKKETKAGTPVAGPGSLPRASEAKVVSRINKFADILQNGITTKDPTTGQVTVIKGGDEALRYLKGQIADPHELNVARSLAANKGKGIGKWGVGEAHKARVHVSGNWDLIP